MLNTHDEKIIQAGRLTAPYITATTRQAIEKLNTALAGGPRQSAVFRGPVMGWANNVAQGVRNDFRAAGEPAEALRLFSYAQATVLTQTSTADEAQPLLDALLHTGPL